MTVRFYSSSDVGAPALRGNTPGDLINLLDKCLVTGYGAKAGAGWTKPFTGTNVAAFRQGAGSNGMYLRVDDTSTAAGYRFASVAGYETMTDVDTGAPTPFPTPSQVGATTQLRWFTNYSGSTVANPRPWVLIADEMFFYVMWKNYPEQVDGSTFYYNECYWFGDIIPFKPGDGTATVISGSLSTQGGSSTSAPFIGDAINGVMSASGVYMSIARSFTDVGGPVWVGHHGDHVKGNSIYGSGNLSYPHAPDGALYLNPIYVHEPQTSPYNVRGKMPGLWQPLHYSGVIGQHNTFEGQGDLLGKTFFGRRHSQATVAFEISDTWDR